MLIILRLLANFGWGVLELPTLKSRCIILANDLGVRVKGHSKNVCQNKTGGGGAQWEKSNKFVPLGKMKKIIF
jgi:hypothetical protein